jgi:hypothetical protein
VLLFLSTVVGTVVVVLCLSSSDKDRDDLLFITHSQQTANKCQPEGSIQLKVMNQELFMTTIL